MSDYLDRRSRARFDPVWEDRLLTAAVAEVKQGRLAAAVELLTASNDPAQRTLRCSVLSDVLEPRLEELGTPEDPHVLLLVGAARVDRAWRFRGGSYAQYTSGEQFRRFHAELKNAVPLLQRAAELLPDDPSPWSELQWHGIGSRLPRPELDGIWHELRRRDPRSFNGTYGRVQAISEKWYGRPGESAAFAEELLNSAEPGHPVTAIAAAAHLEIAWRRLDDTEEPSSQVLREYFRAPSVNVLMREASDLWAQRSRPHPQDRKAHHLLGAVHYFGGDLERARFHLSHAGDSLPKTLPWSVASTFPGRYYAKVQRELKL